ncbi:MAG: Trk system potassium transporter TrkA [Acidimicrobiia bacterium]|nr:Trk system potassium transporter TrkA [Acidimicrobiia bacterium]
MHIVVIGAGAVGSHLAERLSIEGQDVVVVEADASKAQDIQSRLDALVITGNGASRSVLEEARIEDAGLLIAVTNSDAVNILSCQAASAFDVPFKVARVEDPALRGRNGIDGVDHIIDPTEELAAELLRLVRKSGVSEMVEFADGRFALLGGYVQHGARLDGMTLGDLRTHVKGWDWLVTAVVRGGEPRIARGDTTVQAGDHILVMARGDRTHEAIEFMGLDDHRARRAMILGATRLAGLAAERFARNGIHTTILDNDAERCRSLARSSDKVVVVQGDAMDPRMLRNEGIENVDAFLALTGWDEINIVGCLLAKALGAPTTVARFHRFEYVGLLPGVGIDAGVSSRLAAASAILQFVRRGHVHSVATFQDTAAEAIELEVEPTSRAIGKDLREIGLPKSVIVGGVLRGKKAFIPHGDTVIHEHDRLIVVALPEAIRSVEHIFA